MKEEMNAFDKKNQIGYCSSAYKQESRGTYMGLHFEI